MSARENLEITRKALREEIESLKKREEATPGHGRDRIRQRIQQLTEALENLKDEPSAYDLAIEEIEKRREGVG